MKAQLWNNHWKFWEDVDAFALVWNVPENARNITLPHDAMLERAPRGDSPNGNDTGFRDGGNYVYIKQFHAPEDYRDKVVSVKFEGVYMNALVYLNGQLVGKRPYGYSPFVVTLNDYLNYGGDNELRVLVKNNGMPNSRWYSGSGIYRDVWLLTAAPLHIVDNGVKVSTAYIEKDYAALDVSVTVKNRDFRPRSVQVVAELCDEAGAVCATTSFPLTMLGSTEETVSETVVLPSPKLWSAETPSLYCCRVTLQEKEVAVDSAETTFGVRTLRLDSKRGLQVNGETVKLRGACIHHDNGLLGAISCDEAELRRVRILKEAGFNAIRMAHNPASSALLRACDKLGLYVMDEAFDMWSRPKKDNDYSLFIDKWWEEDITALVDNDFNHPSVIFYSLGNEIPEVGTAQGSAFGRDMARLVKRLDPKRYALVSINGVFASGDYVPQIMSDVLSAAAARGEEVGNVNNFMTAMDTHMDDIVCHPLVSERIDAASAGMDLVGYNYMAARYEADAVTYPNRVVVGSETYPPHIPRNWALVKKLPNLIGDFTWTGWDYIGEAGVGVPAYRFGEGGFGAQFPCQISFCGDMDITGFRRPASYFREIVFGLRKAPYITVQDPAHYGEHLIKTPWVISDSQSSWSWKGFEGKNIVVEIYAAGTEVELLLNGTSLGRKACGEKSGYITLFETTYTAGTLMAVAYDGDVELGRMELLSSGEVASMAMEADRVGELRYVNITLCDGAGNVVTDRDMDVTVEVEGAALLGFGSGDPKPAYNYIGNLTRTFRGRAMAIVRGEGTVTVRCDKCSATLNVN